MLIFNAILFAINGTFTIIDIINDDIDKSTVFCAFISGALLVDVILL